MKVELVPKALTAEGGFWRLCHESAGGDDHQWHGFAWRAGAETWPVVRGFRPLTAESDAVAFAKRGGALLSADGRYELFKTSTKYDGKSGGEKQHHYPTAEGKLPA